MDWSGVEVHRCLLCQITCALEPRRTRIAMKLVAFLLCERDLSS